MTSLERRREARYQRRKAAREKKKWKRCAENDRLENIARYRSLYSTGQTSEAVRAHWHQKALAKLKGRDLIFADPDNGLIVPSAEDGPKSGKYVLPSELVDYYRQGSSVVYYQHKVRLSDEFYIRQHRQLMDSGAFPGAGGAGLKFVSTSQRIYFFLLQPEHIAPVNNCISRMLVSPWSCCFQSLEGLDQSQNPAMSQSTIRYAQKSDIPQILFFIKELAAYEKMLDDVVATEELLREWIFDKKRIIEHCSDCP